MDCRIVPVKDLPKFIYYSKMGILLLLFVELLGNRVILHLNARKNITTNLD